MMTPVKKLSPKLKEWLEINGYDIELVKYHMKNSPMVIWRVTGKRERRREGVDDNYPYLIWNTFNYKIKKTTPKNIKK